MRNDRKEIQPALRMLWNVAYFFGFHFKGNEEEKLKVRRLAGHMFRKAFRGQLLIPCFLK